MAKKETFGEINDRIFHTRSGRYGVITNNLVGDPGTPSASIRITLDGEGSSSLRFLSYLKLPDKYKIGVVEKTDNQWQFHSLSYLDIDWDLLAAETSKQFPVVSIEASKMVPTDVETKQSKNRRKKIKKRIAKFEGSAEDVPVMPNPVLETVMIPETTRFVAIHTTVLTKGAHLNIHCPNAKKVDVTDNLIFATNAEISAWVNWAKEVHEAKWPDDIKNQRLVTVRKHHL